jgi:hypothetical protein
LSGDKTSRKGPSTAPPPFDPEEYARDSETALQSAQALRRTTQKLVPPPLHKRVRLAVPLEDLAWFELSPEALELAQWIDGKKTWLELIEFVGSEEGTLHAAAELHDAKALEYEE